MNQKQRYWKFVGKMYVSHLIALIWAALLSVVFLFGIEKVWVQILTSSVTTLIYIGQMYGAAHREGFLDYNRDKIQNVSPIMTKGLTAGLLACIPNLVVILLYFAARYAGGEMFYTIMNVGSRLYFLPFLYFIFALSEAHPWIYFLLLIPIPLGGSIGYILGYHDYSIMEHVVYKNLKITRRVGKNRQQRNS